MGSSISSASFSYSQKLNDSVRSGNLPKAGNYAQEKFNEEVGDNSLSLNEGEC
jgi:hypothetical protein